MAETETTESTEPTEQAFVIQVDGGIGRIICSVPAIEALAQTRRVIVLTSHPEVFSYNPHVYKVYSLNREYLWDDVIRHGEFLYPEPYYNHLYYNQKLHLMQMFNLLLIGASGEITMPNLYFTQEEHNWAGEFISQRRQEHGKDVVMLQCFGSAARVDNDTVIDPTYRSLPSNVVEAICNNTNYTYINASHIPLNFPNVWNQQLTLRQLLVLTVYCDFIIGVDSFLLHVGNACGKNGIAFFGATYPENLSYDRYRTIQRQGYPKVYVPNRFAGSVGNNAGAFDFDNIELGQILKIINDKEFSEADVPIEKTDEQALTSIDDTDSIEDQIL